MPTPEPTDPTHPFDPLGPFDLPARLQAKTAPHLIAADVDRLAAVERALATRRAEDSDRLAATRRRPRGHGEYALERDAEIRRLSRRLHLLERLGPDLVLGRLDPVDGEPVYVGRIGLVDTDGRRLVHDWRSAPAEPYFAATAADPRGLAWRRRYRWVRGRITDYWDEAFTDQALTDPARRAALDEESGFIASLGAERTGRMRDVLGTIQADQDAIIRAGSAGALVVDGGPGTGKTVVALHRVARLLYDEPRLRGAGGALFIGPHPEYLAYVSDVLPSLGEDGVPTTTVRGLLPAG